MARRARSLVEAPLLVMWRRGNQSLVEAACVGDVKETLNGRMCCCALLGLIGIHIHLRL